MHIANAKIVEPHDIRKGIYIKGNDCDGVVLPLSRVTTNYPLNILNIGE